MALPLLLLVIAATLSVSVNGFIPNEWLGLTSPTSTTHVKITENAILNVAYELLESTPRPMQPVKPLSKNAPYTSASKLLSAYYGNKVSTARFQEAIQDFTDANVNVDFDKSSKKLPSAHFDAETFEESNNRLLRLRQEIIAAVNAENYQDGRRKTGQLFHTLQDFYSHSNWIEMGNREPHPSLGVPGSPIRDVAEPNAATCDNCGIFGRCKNNILATITSNRKLTSGYCSGQKDSQRQPVAKPDGIGKCSHGGPMDSSGNSFARGGINKDSDNPLISPHYYHHDEAATIATEASANVLRDVRKVVGNRRFVKYLGLHTGGTMCIVIDSTSSMRDDIEAVKNRTRQIIEKRNGSVNEPSRFVLVTFSDPDYGPAFVTDKPDEFLSKLSSINTTDGGDCPENSFHALRLAIEHTDPYSTCFVFTDASANDAYLKESVIALAKYKNVKVKYMLTGSCNARGKRDTRRHIRAVGVSSYSDVALSTGGEVISLSKGEVMAATTMLDRDLSQSKVTLMYAGQQIATNVLNGRSHYFNVDSTINELVITVKGTVINVKIFNPSGELVKSTGNLFEAVLLLSNLQVTQIANPTAGRWRVRVRSILTYSVSVAGMGTVDFVPSFGVEHGGVHPGVERVVGKPPLGVDVFIIINVIGDNAKLGSDAKVEIISSSGETMKTMPLQTSENMDKFYVKTALPTVPFQIKMIGSDVVKNQFSRIFRHVFGTSKCSVKTDRSDVQRILSAGSRETIPFQAINSGESATYTVSAIDSAGFIQHLKPNRFVLGKNEQMEGEILFDVPTDAEYGTSSTVTLILKGEQGNDDSNYFVFAITIQPKELDEEAPLFKVVQRLGKCSSKHSCNEDNFTVAVEVVDAGMGLYDIITAKESDAFGLTMSSFSPGVPGSIAKAKYEGSCCEPSVELIATDVVGNVARIQVDFLEEAKKTKTGDMFIYIVMLTCGIAALLAVLCACCCCCVVHNRKRSKKPKETTKHRKNREEVSKDKLNPPSQSKSERLREIYENVESNDKQMDTSVNRKLTVQEPSSYREPIKAKYSKPSKIKPTNKEHPHKYECKQFNVKIDVNSEVK